MNKEEIADLFNRITANGNREMDLERFTQAITEYEHSQQSKENLMSEEPMTTRESIHRKFESLTGQKVRIIVRDGVYKIGVEKYNDEYVETLERTIAELKRQSQHPTEEQPVPSVASEKDCPKCDMFPCICTEEQPSAEVGRAESALQDVVWLAEGLAEDDSFFAERRNAGEVILNAKKALKALSTHQWTDEDMRKVFHEFNDEVFTDLHFDKWLAEYNKQKASEV